MQLSEKVRERLYNANICLCNLILFLLIFLPHPTFMKMCMIFIPPVFFQDVGCVHASMEWTSLHLLDLLFCPSMPCCIISFIGADLLVAMVEKFSQRKSSMGASCSHKNSVLKWNLACPCSIHMDCINARNCIFSKQKAEKISEKGHSSLSKRHPTGKKTLLPSYTLSPHKKKRKSRRLW